MKPSRRRLLLAAGFATGRLVFPRGLPGQEPGRLPAPGHGSSPGGGTAGRQSLVIKAAGFEWTCVVHVPSSSLNRGPVPVVLVLHGAGGQGSTMLEKAHWARKAEEAGFLAVAPDAIPQDPVRVSNFWTNPRIWNAGQLSPESPRARVDDIAFFHTLFDELARRYRIDRDRLYVTGHSNGAGMTFRLATEFSDRIAAIAPVASVCWVRDPRVARPMPTLFLAGASDPLVPLRGGESVLPWGKRTTPPVADAIQLWAGALGCPERPRVSERREHGLYFVYGPGRDQATLTAYLIDGQGHNWPGGRRIVPLFLGPENARFDATDAIWDFFKGFRRTGPAPGCVQTLDGRLLERPVKFVR